MVWKVLSICFFDHVVVVWSPSHVWLLLPPWTVACQALCPWDFPGKNTRVGGHFFLQGIFPSQGSNPRLLHWWADSLPLSLREALSYWVSCIWAFHAFACSPYRWVVFVCMHAPQFVYGVATWFPLAIRTKVAARHFCIRLCGLVFLFPG